MSLKIFSTPQNPRLFKSLIAAQYAGVSIEVPAFEFGKDNKTKEFLELNPNGKIPVLVTPEGPIFESNSIARYVASLNDKARLFGNSLYETGLVNQWIDWTAGEIELPGAAWIYPIMGFIAENKEATAKAKAEIRKALLILNNHLLLRTFLVGERITLADIVVSMSLLPLYRMVLEPSFRKQFVNTNRWFNTLINQPEFKAVLGEVTLCEKMQVAAAAAAVAAAPKKEKKPKEEKPKEAPKPKEEKKKPKDDDAEEDEAPKPKPKSALDFLPPTPFNLDEWKRTYSNAEDTRKDAMPWFWEHYDPEGWSLWFSTYNHNEDNTVLYQTCNLTGGYVQRVEELRKYGFGALLILGEKAPFNISCCWLVRGKTIPTELSGCPDSELYTFTQADHTNPAHKELVEDFFSWSGNFTGYVSNVVTDGKVFK